MTEDKLQVPKKTKGDAAHAIAKAGLSAIPVIGGSAAELFQNVIQPPLEKRRIEWMQQVGEKIQELEENGLKIEDLQENEEFISAVMHASQIALKTHKNEKLKALRNAILNIAKGQAPEETLQNIFLNLIDSFTELHICILKLFQNPEPPPNLSMGGLSDVIEHNIKELRGRQDLYDQIWMDLYSHGLVNTDNLHVTMTVHSLRQKRTTGMGDAFLKFIAGSQ